MYPSCTDKLSQKGRSYPKHITVGVYRDFFDQTYWTVQHFDVSALGVDEAEATPTCAYSIVTWWIVFTIKREIKLGLNHLTWGIVPDIGIFNDLMSFNIHFTLNNEFTQKKVGRDYLNNINNIGCPIFGGYVEILSLALTKYFQYPPQGHPILYKYRHQAIFEINTVEPHTPWDQWNYFVISKFIISWLQKQYNTKKYWTLGQV